MIYFEDKTSVRQTNVAKFSQHTNIKHTVSKRTHDTLELLWNYWNRRFREWTCFKVPKTFATNFYNSKICIWKIPLHFIFHYLKLTGNVVSSFSSLFRHLKRAAFISVIVRPIRIYEFKFELILYIYSSIITPPHNNQILFIIMTTQYIYFF